MIVGPVLMTSYHASLKPNIGPEVNQATMTPMAGLRAAGLPVEVSQHWAGFDKADFRAEWL